MNPRQIVVGVDGSELSGAAVRWAAHRALAREWSLRLVHAIRPDAPMFGIEASDEGKGEGRAAALRLLDMAVEHVHAVSRQVPTTTVLGEGYPSPVLVRESVGAAILVVGSKGSGLLSRSSIGATTLQVLTQAKCPVVVLGREVPKTEEHGLVAVAVDGSPASLAALNTAVDHAEHRQARLEVIEVHPSGSRRAGRHAEPDHALIDEHVAAVQREHPELSPTHSRLTGDPVTVLSERGRQADILVVGAVGVGEDTGRHLGTVAAGVIGRATCPIVVCPKPRLRSTRRAEAG